MKTLLRILNVIVFLPFFILGFLFLLWNNLDDKIVRHYKEKKPHD